MPDESRSPAPDMELIRAFAEASPTAVVVFHGPAHRILYANPAFCAAAGRSPDALHGLPAVEAFPHLGAAGHLTGLDRPRSSGEGWTCRSQPLRLPLDEGEPRVWDIEATPLPSAGMPTGLLLRLRDVSAQRRAEIALRDALAAQQAIAREAEHRIKNSFQLVASLLRLQSTHVAEPAGRAALEAATARVLAVAEAHRALQRSPDLRFVRLPDLFHELAAGVAVQHSTTDLRTDAAEDLTLDAERAIPLALVLAELVESAVRRRAGSAPGSEPMRLAARQQGDALLVELTDAGVDVAPTGEAAREPGEHELPEKIVRALTRQIGAAFETERLPRGGVRTMLSLPAHASTPARV